jgi:hypothetical protein
VAFKGNALQHIVSCLGSPDTECKAAAVTALLHLMVGTPWKLADELLWARVKAAGVLDVLRSGSRHSWDVSRLAGLLNFGTDARIRLE